jgi:hypothetical protein
MFVGVAARIQRGNLQSQYCARTRKKKIKSEPICKHHSHDKLVGRNEGQERVHGNPKEQMRSSGVGNLASEGVGAHHGDARK